MYICVMYIWHIFRIINVKKIGNDGKMCVIFEKNNQTTKNKNMVESVIFERLCDKLIGCITTMCAEMSNIDVKTIVLPYNEYN